MERQPKSAASDAQLAPERVDDGKAANEQPIEEDDARKDGAQDVESGRLELIAELCCRRGEDAERESQAAGRRLRPSVLREQPSAKRRRYTYAHHPIENCIEPSLRVR